MRRIVTFSAVFFLFSSLLLFFYIPSPQRADRTPNPDIRIFDGDTVELFLGDARVKVRYLLIDTPELHHPSRPAEELGEESRSLNISLLAHGGLRLEYDVERTDRYGRALAYIFVGDDEREIFLNEELVREGLALPLIIPPNRKYAERILRAFDEAHEARRGLWKRAEGRLFTSAQVWSEAPFLAGSFITLFFTIEKSEVKGRRILLREGRVTVSAYRSPETESLLSLHDGDRIQVVGKLLLTYAGCEIPVASDIQVTRLTN